MKIKRLRKYIHHYEDTRVARYVIEYLQQRDVQNLLLSDGIPILHNVLLSVSTRDKTRMIVTRFMKHEVRRDRMTELEMEDIMLSLGYFCAGCVDDQPNQLAHMGLGGCLYCEENEYW